MTIPSGTELARPFLPAKDFEVSKAFYEALGFRKVLDGADVAMFAVGTGAAANEGAFIVQRYYQQQWAENFMMQLMVNDLDAWWAHIVSLDLPTKFGVQSPKPPAIQPWGLQVAYLYDPAGVLWHVTRRP
jgi:catechol 2,3-dioxygenase-like lactoylglutathione lyase family enzyme